MDGTLSDRRVAVVSLGTVDGDALTAVESQLTDAGATAKISYRNQAQLRSGDGWKVLKTSGKETATVTLVKDDGTWLVEEAR